MNGLREWLLIFWKVLTKPVPSTFREMAENANGKINGSIAWSAFTGLFYIAFILLYYDNPFSVGFFSILILGTFLPPLFLLVLAFCIYTVITKIFHKTRTSYESILFVLAVILVIYLVLDALIPIIPVIGEIFVYFIEFYVLSLAVVAIKAVANLNLWRAILTVALSIIISIVGWFCLSLFILSLIYTVPNIS